GRRPHVLRGADQAHAARGVPSHARAGGAERRVPRGRGSRAPRRLDRGGRAGGDALAHRHRCRRGGAHRGGPALGSERGGDDRTQSARGGARAGGAQRLSTRVRILATCAGAATLFAIVWLATLAVATPADTTSTKGAPF